MLEEFKQQVLEYINAINISLQSLTIFNAFEAEAARQLCIEYIDYCKESKTGLKNYDVSINSLQEQANILLKKIEDFLKFLDEEQKKYEVRENILREGIKLGSNSIDKKDSSNLNENCELTQPAEENKLTGSSDLTKNDELTQSAQKNTLTKSVENLRKALLSSEIVITLNPGITGSPTELSLISISSSASSSAVSTPIVEQGTPPKPKPSLMPLLRRRSEASLLSPQNNTDSSSSSSPIETSTLKEQPPGEKKRRGSALMKTVRGTVRGLFNVKPPEDSNNNGPR